MILHSRQFTSPLVRLKPALLAPVLLCLAIAFSETSFAQSQVSWTFAGPAGASGRIVALAADPRTDSVVYAAAPDGGIWKTQDSGLTWVPQFDSAVSLQVCSIAIDPVFPDILYVGTGEDQSPRTVHGVARSTDGGRTWGLETRFTNQPVCTLAVDPTNSARILAGSGEGLFLSSDSGVTWSKVMASPVTSISFGTPGTVYAGALGGDTPGVRDYILWRSADSGLNWISMPLPRNRTATTAQTTAVSVLVNGSNLSIVVSYLLTAVAPGSSSAAPAPFSQLDFYNSANAGVSWSSTFKIGQARPAAELFLNSVTDTLFVAGNTLLTSPNQGSTWQTVPTETSDFHGAVFTGGTLLLAGEKGLESLPFGPNSSLLSVTQLPVTQILGVSIDPQNGIWGAGPAGLFDFSSSSFGKAGVPGVEAVGSVVTSTAASGSIVVFAAGNSEVYSSTDGGLHVLSNTAIATDELRAPFPPFILDPVNPSSAYVAGSNVYHSSNSGTSWTALAAVDTDPNRVVIALAMAPSSRSTLYAATACLPEVALVSCPQNSVIWRSANAGQSWVQMNTVSGLVNRIAVDPRQSNTLYAAIGAFPGGPSLSAGAIAGDLLKSINGGGAWVSVHSNLPTTPINTVIIDATSLPAQFNLPAQTLYVGTDAGVFVTFNGGLQWTDIGFGLPASPITGLAIAQPAGILAAATFGRGIYSCSITGLAPGLIVNPLSLESTIMQGTIVHTGLALSNVSVNTVTWQLSTIEPWLSVPQSSGSLGPAASVQVPLDASAADLQSGVYTGRIQLITASSTQTISVNAHVTPSPSHITIISGDNAMGSPGSTLPPLQVLISDLNNLPLPGVSVSFTITTGGGTLSAGVAVSNDAGSAGVFLQLPPTPGIVQVAARSGDLSATFTLTAVSTPILLADSVYDGVTFSSYPSFGPGSIISIVGQRLTSSESAVASDSQLPASLLGARALVASAAGDIPLPLFSVSPTQIRALLPYSLTPGTYKLRTELGLVRSNEIAISIMAFDPGIFTLSGSGKGPGVFLKDDGSIVTAANPADRGSRVTFYAAGLGAVNPSITAGSPGASKEPLNRTVQSPKVFFDRYSATVTYSGLAQGIAGRYQVTVQVPPLVSPATNVSVSLTIGGFTSNRVTIPVR